MRGKKFFIKNIYIFVIFYLCLQLYDFLKNLNLSGCSISFNDVLSYYLYESKISYFILYIFLKKYKLKNLKNG